MFRIVTAKEEPAAEPVAEENNVYTIQAEIPAEEVPMRLVIKKEEPVAEDMVVKIGDRVLSADEIEEKRRFEEQKKALEDRAERLRRMSFNIKNNEHADDMENTPAYLRKNVQLDNSGSASGAHYSGYSIGNNNPNSSQAAIQTINTYLDGKKPD